MKPARALVGIVVLGAALLPAPRALSQAPEANEDESKVPPYTLPDPLVLADGRKVIDARTWTEKRRPELLRLFETHVYGRTPAGGPKPRFQVTKTDPSALGGRATRKDVAITFGDGAAARRLDLLVYVPHTRAPAPAFLGLNFQRNDEVKWPVETIVDRGYGVASAFYGDLFPDRADGAAESVLALFPTERGPDAWNALGVWAWALSRALDYLETDPAVDAKRVALLGHSRLGKAALWAGAQDPRFAIVISNESGCGGAALSKRIYGETVAAITKRFPHWFCANFSRYADHEAELPVDQHELLALIAPRPLYVASAVEDRWADPKGEFLAALAADPVYRLLGTGGLPARAMPSVDQPVQGQVAYHVRSGGHDLTDYDWRQYLAFADRRLHPRGLPLH
jgi:(4-O-methyl)-D-glucuronate---lignin esterase